MLVEQYVGLLGELTKPLVDRAGGKRGDMAYFVELRPIIPMPRKYQPSGAFEEAPGPDSRKTRYCDRLRHMAE